MRRGFLADTLEVVFPGDRQAQRIRLDDTVRFVYGGPLSRGQIRDLFADPELRPTTAFEAALVRLASSPKVEQFIVKQAAYARLRSRETVTTSARSTRPGRSSSRSWTSPRSWPTGRAGCRIPR